MTITYQEASKQLKDIQGLDVTAMQAWVDLLLYCGAWLMGALALVGVGYLGWRYWLQMGGWYLQARKELKVLSEVERPNPQALADLNQLLKRAVAAAGRRREAASLAGEAWIDWLKQHAGTLTPSQQASLAMLGKQAYAPQSEILTVDMWQQLCSATGHILKQLAKSFTQKRGKRT